MNTKRLVCSLVVAGSAMPGVWAAPAGHQTSMAPRAERVLASACAYLAETPYYYYDGVYFQATTTGAYALMAPPVGVVVPQLPDGAEAIAVGPTTYYYAGGASYLPQPTGFAVVPAPLGVTVTGLPPGATPVVINGVIYYVAGANYFMPVMQAGVTVYVTARL